MHEPVTRVGHEKLRDIFLTGDTIPPTVASTTFLTVRQHG
jgi:hypothetical protein